MSRLKGGQLGLLSRGRRRVLLILSDVLGNAIDLIGSSPMLGDPSTQADAAAILSRHGLERYISFLTETPMPSDARLATIETVVVGDNQRLVDVAATEAGRLGFQPLVLSTLRRGSPPVGPDVRRRRPGNPGHGPACPTAMLHPGQRRDHGHRAR